RIAELGSNPKLLYRDSYYTGKDVAKADAKLPAHFTIDCPESVVEGETLAPMSICVRSGFLMPVARFKSELDGFFRDLDGVSRSSYFVASIVAKNLATVKKYRAKSTEKVTDDPKTKVITHERGDRYIQLADQVGNGSFSMDIDANSYTPVLDQIGLEIEKRYRVPKFVPTTTFVL